LQVAAVVVNVVDVIHSKLVADRGRMASRNA
jgi:hypothetical protein